MNECPICGGTFYCAPDEFETHKNICRHKAYALEVLNKAEIVELPKCDPRPEPTGKRYTYLVMAAYMCHQHFGVAKDMADSYLSNDQQGKLLKQAIAEGYRWIRSENGIAIWEKEWTV